MGSPLREAFALACKAVHKIGELYDLAGYYAWRALTDDKFLEIDPAHFSCKTVQKAVKLYDWARGRAQEAAFDTVTSMGLSGDIAPKPDLKPGLIRFGETCAPYLARVPWGSPAVGSALLLSFGIAAYAFATGVGGAHGVPELMGTIYGSSPNGTIAPHND